MNDENPTHLLAIEYIAKLEHENADLKAQIAALLKILCACEPEAH